MAKCTRRTRRALARIGSGTSLCLRYRAPQSAERLRGAQLSREANQRLKVLDSARTHSVSQTCRHCGMARSTFSRWQPRYDPKRLSSLEHRPSRPRRCRRSTWTADPAAAVRQARTDHPRWGKDQRAIVLKRQGSPLSVSMIGSMLADLTRRGVLVEPKAARVRPHCRHARPYARRKPKEYAAAVPGDLVQLDTLHLSPLPGWSAASSPPSMSSPAPASSASAPAPRPGRRDFLAELGASSPFPMRALPVDGGSEFMAEFETACAAPGVALFVLPPRSPQRNGHVERANGTARREFWELYDGDLELPPLQAALRAWEDQDNHVRRAPRRARHIRTVADVLNEDTALAATPRPH